MASTCPVDRERRGWEGRHTHALYGGKEERRRGQLGRETLRSNGPVPEYTVNK
jgi:hypothetical protein